MQPGDTLRKHGQGGAQWERVIEQRHGSVRGWTSKPRRVQVVRIEPLDIHAIMLDMRVRPVWVVYAWIWDAEKDKEKLVYAKRWPTRKAALLFARNLIPFERAA